MATLHFNGFKAATLRLYLVKIEACSLKNSSFIINYAKADFFCLTRNLDIPGVPGAR